MKSRGNTICDVILNGKRYSEKYPHEARKTKLRIYTRWKFQPKARRNLLDFLKTAPPIFENLINTLKNRGPFPHRESAGGQPALPGFFGIVSLSSSAF
jgi:hypothetical protein